MEFPKRRGAFTLIELLIVVAIIAILAAIAVPNFLEAQMRSRVSRTMSDMRSTVVAITSYVVDNNEYPLLNPSIRTSDRGVDSFVFDWLIVLPPQPGRTTAYNGTLLTTPVGYITSIPLDVFNTAADPLLIDLDSGRPGNFGAPGTQLSYFSLFCALGSQRGCYVIRGVRFDMLLMSMGPDLNWWTFDDFPPGTWHYDPTNGTLSEGDIIMSDLGFVSPNVSGVPFTWPP